MHYFSGFSLEKEESIFTDYLPLIHSDYDVVGFSYGAQRAFEFAYEKSQTQRIQRLILFSPAFFQTQKPSFVRTQLRYFEADTSAYIQQFLLNTSSSVALKPFLKQGTREELEGLLNYVWDADKIKTLLARGVKIEVFLGEEDKIIDPQETRKFFEPLVTLYWLKEVGHSLQMHKEMLDKKSQE